MDAKSKFSFTTSRLKALRPPATGRSTVRDTTVPGLAIRVTAAGAMTAIVDKKLHGRHVRHRLGGWPGDFKNVAALRDAARRVLVDPDHAVQARQAARVEATLADLFNHWLAHAKAHKRSWANDVRQFDKYLKPLHNRRLSSITKVDVARLHVRIGEDHGPYTANRVLSLLSAMYGKADEVGHEGPNPCRGVKRFRESSRERFLQPDEMKPFFEAVKAEPPLWQDFWLVCLFSGARRGNVAAMAWENVDLDAAAWYLPGQQAKSGVAMVIVLCPLCVGILRRRREAVNGDGCPWVFPGPAGHIVSVQESWSRVVKRAKLVDLRPHDLRRSLGSWQAVAGASLPIIGKSLGHTDLKATAVYSRLQLDPVRRSVTGATEAMAEAGGLNTR